MARWRAVLVVACVLAAGCSSATGGWSSTAPESTRTLTPAPVPETPALSRAVVPGVSPDGSVDTRRLANAHAAVVDNRNYTWVFRLIRTDPRTGTRVVDATRRVRVGETGMLVEDEGFADYPPNQTVYLADGEGYRRLDGSGPAIPLSEASERRDYAFAASLIRFNLRDGGYRLRAVERGGKRFLRLSHPPADPDAGNVTESYTARLDVARTGFVRSLSVSYTDLRGHHVTFRFRYVALGSTSAPEPSWAARAPNRSGDRAAENGSVSPTAPPAAGTAATDRSR